MKKITLILLTLCYLSISANNNYKLFPEPKSKNILPDAHLTITFNSKPTLNNNGKIKVYRYKDNKLVDVLDMNTAPGPTVSVNHGNNIPPYTPEPYLYQKSKITNKNTKPGTPSGLALANSDTFQLNIIGHFSDAFHFYPVIIKNNVATLYLHNNMLEYNEKYYITVDAGIFKLQNEKFNGINDKTWNFCTKINAPSDSKKRLVVDGSGNGDFSTIQGAVDFIPDSTNNKYTIFIRNGKYEEIVYFRNKSNITFIGENRDSTIVHYANNEVFNPHPSNLSTNEWPGTFPSRRAAFACDNSNNIRFENFTIATTAKGQAEGLLIMGDKIYLKNMHIIGSGDAIQINGPTYLEECEVDGDGDTFLGRGPAFFNRCTIRSWGTLMWVRNTSSNHGVVLNDCNLICSNPNGVTEIARAPDNKGKGYPYCEVVLLNCKLSGISNSGWGPTGEITNNIHYWELNSTDLNGFTIDTSLRSQVSKQLDVKKDSDLIKNYSTPAFILNGWNP